jgi:hypothetical protein
MHTMNRHRANPDSLKPVTPGGATKVHLRRPRLLLILALMAICAMTVHASESIRCCIHSRTSLRVSSASVDQGAKVTLTAHVFPFTATGTVSFSLGTKLIGISTDIKGTAKLSLTTLPVGKDAIQAKYSGDKYYYRSKSPPVTIVVK